MIGEGASADVPYRAGTRTGGTCTSLPLALEESSPRRALLGAKAATSPYPHRTRGDNCPRFYRFNRAHARTHACIDGGGGRVRGRDVAVERFEQQQKKKRRVSWRWVVKYFATTSR